jgi:hypothetical protein
MIMHPRQRNRLWSNWCNCALTSLGVGLGLLGVACSKTAPSVNTSSAAISAPPAPSPKPIAYQAKVFPHSIVHTLTIPAYSQYRVEPVVAPGLETVENLAQQTGAVAALNAGFFDPKNQKSTSSVIAQGQQLALPEDNDRLMNNPDLLPYLDKILNRSELRHYQCTPSNTSVSSGPTDQYDVVLRQAVPPPNCQLKYALGGGPQLLPTLTLADEGFWVSQGNRVVRDSVGAAQRNARTAIGLLPDGGLVWVMVAQKPNAANSGMTLPELATFLKSLKVEKAINLDGGSSSSLYYNGQTLVGKVDSSGGAIVRPIKSALLVLPQPGTPPK